MAATDPITLFDLPTGVPATVLTITGIAPDSDDDHGLALRLFEIGFVEGEPVRVVARGFPGGEPIAVRVGATMFALRRFEAERVLVGRLPAEGDGR